MALPREIKRRLDEHYGKPIAGQYGEAVALLHRRLEHKPDAFELSVMVAVEACKKAQAYEWPEVAEIERHNRMVEEWASANKAAGTLADYLDRMDNRTALVRLVAATNKAGLTIKPTHKALAKLLRAFAGQDFKRMRPATVSRRYGPLLIDGPGTGRQTFPGKATVLTVALAHLFRRACEPGAELVMQTYVQIEGCTCWDVAPLPSPTRRNSATA